MRRGASTSEFWLSLLAVVVGAVVASGLLPTDGVAVRLAGIASTTLAALGYTASRTSLKKGGSP
jgi:hypothetical protein